MADDKDKYLFNRQTAYDLLKQEGYTDIGESAEDLFKDRGNSELAYKLLRKAGYTDLGKDYDEFATMLYGPAEEANPAPTDNAQALNFDDEPNLAPLNERARKSVEKEAEKAAREAQRASERATKDAQKARRSMTPQERTKAFNQQVREREAEREQRLLERDPEAYAEVKRAQQAEDEAFRARVEAERDERERAVFDDRRALVERYAPGRKDDRSLYFEPSDELILDNAAKASGYSVNEAIRLGKEYGSIADENDALREQIAAFNAKWGQGGTVAPSHAGEYKAEYEAIDSLLKQNEDRYKAMMSSPAGREFSLLQGKVEELRDLPDSPEKTWGMTQLIAQISRNPIARASMGDGAPSGSQIDFDLMKGEIDYMQGRIANGSADKAQKKEYKARIKELQSRILDNEYYQQDVARRIEETGAELEDVYSRMLAIRERTLKDKPLGETLDDALLAEPEYQNLRLSASQLEQRKRKLGHIRDKNSGDFWVNFADVFADPNTYNFGLVNLETSLAAKSAFDEMDKPGAKTLLSAVVGKQEAESESGEFVGAKGRWGEIAAGSIPFIANIALTGGFSGVAGAVERGIAEVAGKEAAEKFLVKATGKVAGDLAAGFVSANTIGGATTANDILNNYFGRLVRYENGEYGYIDGTNLFHAIRKGEISNMLEYSTERFGDHVQRLLGLSIARGAKNGAISLGRETFARSFGITTEDLRKLGLRSMDKGGAKWVDHAMDFLGRAGERAGVQGYPFEVMEEEVNILGNAILYGGDKWMDFGGITDKEQQADIWGGMLYSIGVMQGSSIGIYGAASGLVGLSNMKAYKKMESQLEAVSAAAERAIGDRWASIKEDLEEAGNEEMPTLVVGIANSKELTDTEKEMALSYIKGLYILRGFNAGTLNAAKRRIVGDDQDGAMLSLSEADSQITDAYMLGYMSDPDNADELQKAFTRQQESLRRIIGQSDMTDEAASEFLANPDATSEQKDAVVSYLMAKAATQGLVDARENERIALKSTLQMVLENGYGGEFYYRNPDGEIVVEKTFVQGTDGKWIPSFILSAEPNASGEVPYRMQNGITGFVTRDKVGTIDEQGNIRPGETVVTSLDGYMDAEADAVEAVIAAQKAAEDAEKEKARKEAEGRLEEANSGKKARLEAETATGLKEAVRRAVSGNGGRISISGVDGTLTHETEEGATFSPDDESLDNRPMSWREIAEAMSLTQDEAEPLEIPEAPVVVDSEAPVAETPAEDENGIPRDPETGKYVFDAPGVTAQQAYDAIYGSGRYSEKNADKFVISRADAADKALSDARRLVEEGEAEKSVIDDWDLKDGEDLEDLEARQQIAKSKVDGRIAKASEQLPELERKAAHWGKLRQIAERNTSRREKEKKQEAKRKRLIEKYGVDTSRFDLTPQTLEEAVAAYLGGDSTGLINLDDAIRETVGRSNDGRVPLDIFRHVGRYGILTKNGGRSIQDVASDIVREFYGDLEHDAQQDEARNTIIDFLLGKTKKEMREFIFNNRLEAAEKELTLLNDEYEVLRSAGVGSPAGNQDGAGTADGGGLRAEPGSHATDGGTGTDGGRVLPGLARREQGAGGNAEKLEVAADERSGADGYSDGQSQQEVFDRHPGEPARGAGRPDSGSDESGELGAEGADGGKRSRVADGLSGAVRPGTVRRGVPSHRVGLKGLLSYVRHSKGKSLDTVSPSAIAEANDKTLSEIEKQYGSVDGFVMDELGYDSKEALYAALSAEQIDSVAMAIYQMKKGKAMIIGDQTGVGKGRQMAALIRWANRQGKKPIFFTKDDTLFSDLYRDMKDTGSQSLRPLIINAKAKMIDGDSVAYSAPSETELDKIVQDGQVPDGYDYVVLTYSQLSSGDAISRAEKKSKTEGRERSMARADFIRKIARDNYLFCDESHTAAGRGQTGAFMRSIIPSTIGVTFASATFAKRPDSMPLYAIKSAMVEAKVGALELIQMVQRGGVTLQEILSRNLAEAGQMVRRQRLMNDVKTEWKTVTNPELAEKAKEGYDGVIGLYKDIVDFRRNHGGAFSAPNTYAFVRQLLLSLKVDAIVEEAVSELKAGRKPIIALENTRESSISDFQFGDELPVATFGLTLAKMLGGADGLDEEGQRNYQELLDRIRKVTKDIPASPIDTITEKLEALGYKVGEITGRTKKIVTRDGKPVVEKQVIEPVESARSFNNGETNALIINRSGATGISLHASETFDDQKQRTMIIAQPLGDINEYQQMLGRIDRTGQVARGNYINLSLPIPAEQRFNMMLANKLRSLSANTTAESGAGNIEAPDLLNRYGAKVMCEYLQDNPEVFDALGIQLGYKAHPVRSIEDLDRYTPVEEDAEKITAALALIPIEQQEAFYEDVTRRYEDLVKSLDEAGQNELKSTTLPLRARTLSKKVGTRGKDPDGSNPFAKDSYIERVEVDVLTKPMTVSEIEEAREALGGKEAIKKLLVRLEAQRNARLEAEERRYGEFKAKNEGQDLSDAEARHAANVARINRIHDVIAENLKRFSPDRTYLIHEEFGMDAEDNYGRNGKIGSIPGVLIGFKAPKDGESLTPSKMNAVFATLDGRRKVEVKLSDGFILDDIWGNTEANPEEASRTTLDNWDSSIPKETREERYILTGNVLQAWADVSNGGVLPGRLAYFTDQDGNIRYGILMNKSWMPERSGSAGSPISDFLQAILDGKVVRSIDGKVQVQKATDGYFKGKILLIVPKAVKDGGAIAKDKAVIRMVNGQNFSTHNYNYKLAAVAPKKLPELLQYLSEKYKVRVNEAENEQPNSDTLSEDSESENLPMFGIRTKDAPKKTRKVFKLMRLGADGKLYPLFIDSASPIEIGKWYDADGPDMDFLKKMPTGVFLVNPNDGTYTSLEDYANERGEKAGKNPSKEAINEATTNGMRWVKITDTERAQRRYEGESRKYENIGINGSGGVSTFAMRPGWHAGSLPTMRQIGKGPGKNLRDDNFVWVEGEVAADVDYNSEAQMNPGKDIPTHIPTDGFYMKATNANAKASQADRVGWYVAGAFKPTRIISDAEARAVIDEWNETHQESEPVEYDWPRESGEDFAPEGYYRPTVPNVDQKSYQSRLEDVRARMAEAAKEHGKDSEEYRSLKNEEKEVISDYIDAMDPDHIKVDVISADDAESFYRSLGYDEESTADFVEFIRNNPVAAEYIPKTGSIVFFTENQFDMEVTRRAYTHERQHHLTVKDGLHKLLAQSVGNDVNLLAAELAKLTDAATASAYREFYGDEAAEGLANEIISYAMEKVYTDPGFANVLDNLHLAEEIGKFLNVVIDGQFKASVRPAIQGRNYGRINDAGGNQGGEQAPAGEPGEVQGPEGASGGAESNPSQSIDTAGPADIHSLFGLPKAVEHINDLSILLGVPFKMDDSINGKGKFSPSTGTVSINFSAHKDIADLERTYLHEAVAHFGLRALYGKEWGKVRKNLYEKASPEIKAKVDAIAKNDGLSVEVAMEEYIAELAEDGRFTEEEETFWKKVVDAVLSFFAELGIGEKLLTDSDFRAMLYASYRNLQNAGAIEKAAQVVTYQNLRSMADAERETDGNTDGDNPGGGLPSPGLARETETETETETDSAPGDLANVPEEYWGDMADLLTDEEEEDLFRRNRSYIVAETASDVYSRRTASPWQNIRAQLVDEYQPVLNLIRAILNSKGDLKSKDVSSLKDDERVVERLVEKSSREMYEIERYGTEFMRPMQDAIGRFIKSVNKSAGKDGRIQMKDLVRYACLKHSLERNGVFARRDAKIAAKKVYEDAYAKRKKDLDERERTEKTRLQVKLDEGIISDVTFHNETVRLEAELQQLRDKAKSDLDANIANVDNETAREYKRILGETRQVDYSALMSWFENPSTLKRSDYPSREKFNEAKAAEKRSYVDGVTDLASAEAMALAYVEDMERRAGTEATGELWRSINAATKETLRMQNEHGILSAKQYSDLSGMFQYYLPMRGFEDPTAETTYVYYNSPRGDGFAPTVVTAKGRKGTMFKDPFGMIGFMHSSAVSQGLKNEAKLALLTLVRHYPTDLVTISRTWYQKTGEVDETGKPIYMPVFPVIPDGTSTKDREGIVSKFEKDMEDLRSKGEAYNSLSGIVRNGGIVAFEKDTHKQEHIIRVLEGGKEYDIIINGNPAAAQAINGLPARSKAVQYTAAAFDSVRNFMSRTATTWNPGFWVVNFFRDTIQGVSNAFIRDGFGYLAKYGLNWARIVTQIAFHSAGAEKMMARIDPKIAAYYKEFNENGGPMRWARIEDDASYTRKINRYIRLRQYEKANSMNLARFLGRILSSIGESIETLTRFTTFVTSREAGKALHESIADAKEITTNFSRKGRRSYSYDDIQTWQYENGRDLTTPERVAFTVISWLAGTLRHFIMFFNPSVQGVEQTRSNFANHPYRTSLVAATYMLAGFCMMFLRGAGDGDGDDEKDEKDLYSHAPDYHRRKFFLIPTGEGHYVRIPLPQEYRAFYELGDIAASAFLQDRPFEMLTHDAFTAIMDLGPVGVFADEAGPLHSVLPSWLVPPAEIKMNKNFMGGRVYDDSRYERFDPEWTKALPKTGEGFLKLSKELNRISGGGENNDIVQGAIDVNPDIIEHLINGYLGGMVREAELATRYARSKKRGDSVKEQEIPLIGRILYDVGDRDAHYTDLYYHFRDIAQKAENLDKQFRDRRNSGGKQIDDFYASKDYQYMLAFKEADAEERDLKAERKDAERRNDKEGEKDAELKIQRLHEMTGKRCLEIYLAQEHR